MNGWMNGRLDGRAGVVRFLSSYLYKFVGRALGVWGRHVAVVGGSRYGFV